MIKRLILIALVLKGVRCLDAGDFFLERTIPLPGVSGRLDHFGVDALGARLFVAALGNDSVEVIDLKQGKVIRSITGFSEPQGLLFLPRFNRLYIASGGDGRIATLDGVTFAPIKSQELGDDADNLRYDEVSGQVVVGFGGGGLAFIDPTTGSKKDSVALPAHPESFEIAKGERRIFVNVPGAHQIAVVDRRERKVVSTWDIGAASANFPLALDEGEHRLFVGCRSPASLVVVDTGSGKKIGSVPLDGDCDDIFFDAPSHQIIASCGGGFLDIFAITPGGTYALASRIPTASGARTCVISGRHLYLAVPKRGDQPAAVWCYRIGP